MTKELKRGIDYHHLKDANVRELVLTILEIATRTDTPVRLIGRCIDGEKFNERDLVIYEDDDGIVIDWEEDYRR